MLTDREAHILDFEAHHRVHAGRKEEAIRSELGMKASRYYQLLNDLIEREDAVRADPLLVRGLRDARESRTKARESRKFESATPAATPVIY